MTEYKVYVFGPPEEPRKFKFRWPYLSRRGVQLRDGEGLGPIPRELLYRFLEKPKLLRSSKMMLRALGSGANEVDFAKTHVSAINRVLGGHAIKNERKVGYYFAWEDLDVDGVVVVDDVDDREASIMVDGVADHDHGPLYVPHAPIRGILRSLDVSPAKIPRSAALAKLKAVLLRQAEAGSLTCLTAAAGMGGIGKTVLASLAMEDTEVQQRFPDGIIAVTIGLNPGDTRKRDAVRVIHGALENCKSDWELDGLKLNRLLKDKAVLLVVDDVWAVRDIEWLLTDLGRSSVLITTRRRDISTSIAYAATVEADFLMPEEARELLAYHSGVPTDSFPPEADKILLHCGHRHDDSHIPAFAVCLAGAVVKSIGNWGYVLKLFKESQIQAIGPIVPLAFQNHRTIYDWIAVSVDALSEEVRKAYLTCHEIEDDKVSEEGLFFDLWGSGYPALLDALDSVCLLNWHRGQNGSAGSVTFHDLHLDYLRYRHKIKLSSG
jgi:hypothetical protein